LGYVLAKRLGTAVLDRFVIGSLRRHGFQEAFSL